MEITEFTPSDPRVESKVKELRKWLTLDVATNLLAMYMVASELDEKIIASQDVVAEHLGKIVVHHKNAHLKAANFASITSLIARLSLEKIDRTRRRASNRGKVAATIRHNQAGGSVSKREAIQKLWASGKFASRSVCADQECAGLNMSYDAARKALRNTPNPT